MELTIGVWEKSSSKSKLAAEVDEVSADAEAGGKLNSSENSEAKLLWATSASFGSSNPLAVL